MADSKASKLRPPSKIGRPCCAVPPKPALPPSSPRSSMNSMEPLWESHGRRLSEAGLRRGSDTSVILTEDTDSFIIGDRVWVGGTKPGSIAYIGETQFAPGDWAGVVLDEPIGKNDGSVAGSRYFQCEPKRGIFSRLTRLTRQPLPEAMIASPTGEKTPTSPMDNSRGNLNKSMSPSLNASTTSLASVSHKDLKLGDRVIVSSSQGSKTGVLRFMGVTEFAAGEWCGVELDDAIGKNDGSVGDIRYFECRPRHGLFAPLHKVSRSPSSRRTSAMCAIHKPTGASMNSSMRRIGASRESLASMSSVASTNASAATRGTASGSRRPGLRTSTPARSSMQEMLKEKQQEIEMLRKERDFERERISKAATQADNAEHTVMALKQEYQKYREDMEKTVREAQAALAQLLDEKNSLKVHLEEERQKSEDLLFRFEEESVNKDDIQVVNTLNESKLKELEKQLSEERERVIQLEQENTKLFEAEEEIAKLRTELATAMNRDKKDFQDIENRNLCLEEAKITLEKQMLERNDLIERYAAQISDFEMRLKERDSEAVTRKDSENVLQKDSDDLKRNLFEKSAMIEKMKGEHEIDMETLRKEMEQLKQTIENITKDSATEKELLTEQHRRIIDEKESTIRDKIDRLQSETKRYSEMHKNALEKLRADNVERINELSENFKKQLADKDSQIDIITRQLEDKTAEIERLIEELSLRQIACRDKDEELKMLLERLKELNAQLEASEEANGELKNQMDNLRFRSEEIYTSFAQEKRKLEASMASLLVSSSDSSAQLEKLNEHLKKKEKELSELRDAKTAEIEELKKSFESQIENKRKYITEMSADISEKSLRLSALEREVCDLKLIIANKDEEIKNLLEKVSELQDAVTLSEQTKTNLENELRMYDVNIADLNEKLTEQKTKLEAEKANVTSTCTNSTDQLVEYNEELRRKEKELQELRDRSVQIEKSLALAESKIASAHEELSASKELAKECRAESDELKIKINTETKARVALTSEIEGLKAKELILLEASKDKDQLVAQLKRKNSDISELTDKLRRTEESVVDLNEKNAALRIEASNVKEELENASVLLKNEIAQLRAEADKLEKRSEHLTAERAELEKSIQRLTENVAWEIEEKKKLESAITDGNSQIQRLEEKIVEIKRERDEASAAANSSREKYNDTLTELVLLNSTRASAETENSLELASLREQLARAETNNNRLADRLSDAENTTTETNEKLNEFTQVLRAKESENSILSKNLEGAENSLQHLKNQLDSRRRELEEISEERAMENCQLGKQIESLKSQLSLAMNELVGRDRTVEDKKTQMESVTALADRLRGENENLQEKIVGLSADLTSRDRLVDEIRKEMDSLREIHTKLEIERNSKIEELVSLNEHLRANKESAEKTLTTGQERIESLTKQLREMESSNANEIRSLEEDLDSTRGQIAQLTESQHRLEKENKRITEKLNQASEDLKTLNENMKNNREFQQNENYPTNLKIQSAGGDVNQNSEHQNELKKLADEIETYKGQIDFLNSVIVDMQRKNETLVCKIEVLEMGVPANEADDYSRSTLDKRTAAPRMFCDICDEFDLHETDDCPRQAQDFAEAEPPKKSPKKSTTDRPYCRNCEMFGHDTLDCDDAETF